MSDTTNVQPHETGKKPRKVVPAINMKEFPIQVCPPLNADPSSLGIYKQIVREGKGLVAADKAKKRYLHYGYVLVDGELLTFDDGYSLGQERLFKETKTFPFFKHCLLSMKQGEQAWFKIGPDYGFGNTLQMIGAGNERLTSIGGIPPKSTLFYFFELTYVDSKRPEPTCFEERMKYGEEDRLKGNEEYRKGNYDESLSYYNRAKYILDNAKDAKSDDERYCLNQAIIKVCLNLIKTYLVISEQHQKANDANASLKNVKVALLHLRNPILMDESCLKEVRYLKSKANYFMNEFEEAMKLINEVLEMDPNYEKAKSLRSLIQKKIDMEKKKHEDNIKKTMKKFLSNEYNLYEDANPNQIIEEWERKQQEDKRLGRKVWFTNTGEEFYSYGATTQFEDVTSK
jgi:tetratricopeptide (TPR) repeat protein